mmetsp:Transcript_23284/g.26525  ORF Transcript_23284/g.26525 Transcript_23284/m.26525 type:complete len:661 (+) Transcript_23284:65-2047(+)
MTLSKLFQMQTSYYYLYTIKIFIMIMTMLSASKTTFAFSSWNKRLHININTSYNKKRFSSRRRNNKSSLHIHRTRNHIVRNISSSTESKLYAESKSISNNHYGDNNDTNLNKQDYYSQILHNPVNVMAPMVAQSDLPFRLLCRQYNTHLCYTQMMHSSNFISSTLFQDSHLDVYKENEKLIMTPSGWNALKGLDWISFEKDCFLLKNNGNGVDHNHDVVEKMIQECQSDYQQFMSSSSSSSSKNGNGNIQTSYGRYYSEQIHNYGETETETETAQEVSRPSSPLIVQLAGHDPHTMSKAAQIILDRTNKNFDKKQYNGPVSGIDINCGCPQAIARKGQYGAFLMESNLDAVCNVISQLKNDLPNNVGVSAKIRIPEQIHTTAGQKVLKARICQMIDSGVDLITVHGRTIKENKTKVRQCNWDAICQVAQIAREYSNQHDFPIISNGGIEFHDDIQRCLDQTNVNAVMSSEALLENPGLFSSSTLCSSLSPQEIFERQIKYCHEYLDLCVLYPPLPGSLGKVGGSFNVIRSHAFKFLYRYLEEHTDLRTILAHPTKATSIQHVRDIVKELEKRYNSVNGNEKKWMTLSSSKTNSSWYRRHRDAMASNRMKTRGQKEENPMAMMSTEEKKIAIQKRIQKLKQAKMQKGGEQHSLKNEQSMVA